MPIVRSVSVDDVDDESSRSVMVDMEGIERGMGFVGSRCGGIRICIFCNGVTNPLRIVSAAPSSSHRV